MTVVVLWYERSDNSIMCAADSKITSAAGTTRTDKGPKILPVPIAAFKQIRGPKFESVFRFNLGFAFSGVSATAINAHAITSACSQHLLSEAAGDRPPSVRLIAEILARASRECIADSASRLADAQMGFKAAAFDAVLFGHCFSSKRYRSYYLSPSIDSGALNVSITELDLSAGPFVFGSGQHDFRSLCHGLQSKKLYKGLLPTLSSMIDDGGSGDVGGYMQVGMAKRNGFQLIPVLNTKPGNLDRSVTFLGVDTAMLRPSDEFRIGFTAIRPDM